MMENLEKCRLIYLKLTSTEMEYEAENNIEKKLNNRDWISLKKKIRSEISTLELNQKFRHRIFDCILNNDEGFVEQQPTWDYKIIARAFEHLEKYCRLLRTYPWKTEYHTIKIYGGFFNTHILSVLPSCMEILQIIGYCPVSQGLRFDNLAQAAPKPALLKLRSLPPRTTLLETVGFDCLAASVECEIRSEQASPTRRSRNLHQDGIKVAKATRSATPSEFKIQNTPLLPCVRDIRRKSSSSNLPKELEAYPHKFPPSHTNMSDELTHDLTKTRSYHSEQLDFYQKQRNMLTNLDSEI